MALESADMEDVADVRNGKVVPPSARPTSKPASKPGPEVAKPTVVVSRNAPKHKSPKAKQVNASATIAPARTRQAPPDTSAVLARGRNLIEGGTRGLSRFAATPASTCQGASLTGRGRVAGKLYGRWLEKGFLCVPLSVWLIS